MQACPHCSAELTMWARIGEIAAAHPAGAAAMVDSSHKSARHSSRAARVSPTSGASAPALDALMDRCACGDDATFDELYRRGAPRVRGFLLRLSGDEALADDLAQETFLRVWAARGSFEKDAAALPWMLAIARNAYIDWTRLARVRREVMGTDALAGSMEAQSSLDTRGDETLAASEMLVVVRATLAKMPVLLREAFVLLRFEGLSVNEAAQVLSATDGAVKVRAFRAYELLRAALAREPGEGR